MSSRNQLHFEVSANLQKLIGEELISNDEMAFIELVKNAYDSGAKHVTITIHQETLTAPAYITILDDGEGMELSNFQKRFMFAGYSERESDAASADRIPTGEKGIGRFAADKIGAELTVTTKTRTARQALQVRFNWEDFRHKSKKFNEVYAPYSHDTHTFQPTEQGTLLKIENLRSKWGTAKIDDLKSALARLSSPYSAQNDFQITLEVLGPRPSSEIILSERPVGADYELQFKVVEDGRVLRKFKTPSNKAALEWKQVPGFSVPLLSGLKGRLLYYIKKPARSLSKGLLPGVQLYRDGFLMQPFGSPLSDRLKLIEKRAKRAGHAPLVPNRVFGFVDISRLLHPRLKDTSSRQDMLVTEELHQLVSVLKSQTDFLEENLLEEVARPNWRESRLDKAIMLERARLNSLGNLSIGIGHEIRQPLQSIMSHSDAIEIRLEDLGLTKDADLAESLKMINEATERIDQTITFIKQLSSGDLEDISSFDVAGTIRRECQFFVAENDDITFDVKGPKTLPAVTNHTTVIHVVANLIRNSVEAIREVQDERSGQITVSIGKEDNSSVFEVKDNGVGIPDETAPKIFKKFATQKTGGLGFGLSYCKTIVEAQCGSIEFDSEVNVGTTFRVKIPNRA